MYEIITYQILKVVIVLNQVRLDTFITVYKYIQIFRYRFIIQKFLSRLQT